MSISFPSSSSKFKSFLHIPNPTNLHSPTHLKFPTFSPSISLKTNKNGWSLLVPKMGTYNVQVMVDENEHEERLLNRFRREVLRAGVIQECKRRRFFENSQDKAKRKTREAAKKYRQRRPRPRIFKQDNVETPKKKASYDSDDDDWDLPEGDLPY